MLYIRSSMQSGVLAVVCAVTRRAPGWSRGRDSDPLVRCALQWGSEYNLSVFTLLFNLFFALHACSTQQRAYACWWDGLKGVAC